MSTPNGGADPAGLVSQVGPVAPDRRVGTRHTWVRNVSGLQRHAQEKAETTQRRAEAALAQLVKEHRPVNFRSVAEQGHISTAWLYEHEDLKQQIVRLRAQQQDRRDVRTAQASVWIPPRERASGASKDRVIAALRTRVAEQQALIRDLRHQLEVAYGLVQAQRLGEA